MGLCKLLYDFTCFMRFQITVEQAVCGVNSMKDKHAEQNQHRNANAAKGSQTR
ncbi:hypothetical protein [Gluconobacter oxydans]|uniref:hypothetical protein n=1 Tax=Gluconobacter oxydans TaxID=442 RepID=UPI001EE3C32F|nr:hypothetical protein [Gluconobacter oxydans]